jgi:hypothetical protein
MDWKDLREEPSSDPRTVEERRRQWLIAAQKAQQEEAEESAEDAEAAMQAEREAAAAQVHKVYPLVGNVREIQANNKFQLEREIKQEEGENVGANDMQIWQEEENLNQQQQNWFTGPPQFEEQDDKSLPAKMIHYNIIDIITINNITNKQIVYNCNLLTEAIFAILDKAYVTLDLKKNGGNVPVGWEYTYIVCELILNTEFFIALIDNRVFDNGLFMYFYTKMYEHLSTTINNHPYPNTDMYILGIIDYFNKLFAAIPNGIQIKQEFIMKIAYYLPISFLFTNPVEVEFPMLLKDIIILRPLIPRCLQSSNTELMSCINASRGHIEGQLLNTPCLRNYNENKEYCDQGIASIAGGSYNNNIIKKLKIKKRATKRRQHKSQIFKKLKKHKSQKQKIQRKYKSKKPRKHKLIFSKTFKKNI